MTDKTFVGYTSIEATTDSYDYDHIMCWGNMYLYVHVYTLTYVCMTYIYISLSLSMNACIYIYLSSLLRN